MPSVIVRQAIDLYGVRYRTGLRDIPEGHQCGDEWDYAVKCGYVEPVAKKAAVVADPVVDVVGDTADAVESVDDAAEVQTEKPSRKKRG